MTNGGEFEQGFFRAIIEDMAQGVVCQDAEGRIIQANPAAERILGLDRDELEGRYSVDPRWRCLREDGSDFPGTEHPSMVALRTGEPVACTMAVFNPREEGHRWIAVHSTPKFRPGEDRPYRVCSTFEDITDLRRTRDGLAQSEQLLVETGRMARVGGWDCDVATGAVTWSTVTREIHEVNEGYRPTLAEAMSFFHPDDRPRLEEAWRRAVEKGEPYDLVLRFTTAWGRELVTHTIGHPVVDGGRVVRMWGTFQDITERWQVEEDLRRATARLEEAQGIARIGSWEYDVTADNPTWSREMFRIFGVDPAAGEPSWKEHRRSIHPDDWDRIDRAVRSAAADGSPYEEEFRIVAGDGSLRWARTIGRAVRDDRGTITLLRGTVQDIDAAKAHEQRVLELDRQLQQTQRLESIGRLAGGVAHDFNNMLAVILGYGEGMLDDLHPADPLRRSVGQIVEAGRRSATLVRQLLAFSRRQALESEVVNLSGIVRDLEKLLGRLIGEDLDLAIDAQVDPLPVLVDPGQMEQVIMNLVVNARDAIPTGGTIVLRTGTVTLDGPETDPGGDLAPGTYARLLVIDTGCGMDRDTIEQVFEPFFTTKGGDHGTGLGLSTVYGIVTQSGGAVRVESAPGQGSIFEVRLPLTTEEPVEPGAADAPAEPLPGRGERILLVEDEPAVRGLLEEQLAELGYRVTPAANGGEALLLVEEDGLCPDLVLTDVVMPRMNGRVMADRLKRNHPDLKVVFMSGYEDDTVSRHGILAEGTILLQKPIDLPMLATRLREILDGSEPAR